MFRRCIPLAYAINRSVSRGFWNGPPAPKELFYELNRRFGDLERQIFSNNQWNPLSGWRPFAEHPMEKEHYRVRNPIVEEDGVKKFKLEFDVRRFTPENIKVSTTKEGSDSMLTVEAKHKDESSSFEFQRKVTIPGGVDPKTITARYTSDGCLIFEAPYNEPKRSPPKEQNIVIEHN